MAAPQRLAALPNVKNRIEDTGSLIVGSTPAQFALQIKAEFEIYKGVLVKQKLTLERDLGVSNGPRPKLQ